MVSHYAPQGSRSSAYYRHYYMAFCGKTVRQNLQPNHFPAAWHLPMVFTTKIRASISCRLVETPRREASAHCVSWADWYRKNAEAWFDRQLAGAGTIQHYPDALFYSEHMALLPTTPVRRNQLRTLLSSRYGCAQVRRARKENHVLIEPGKNGKKHTHHRRRRVWDRTLPTPCWPPATTFVSLNNLTGSVHLHGIPEYLAEDAEFVQGDVQDQSL